MTEEIEVTERMTLFDKLLDLMKTEITIPLWYIMLIAVAFAIFGAVA